MIWGQASASDPESAAGTRAGPSTRPADPVMRPAIGSGGRASVDRSISRISVNHMCPGDLARSWPGHRVRPARQSRRRPAGPGTPSGIQVSRMTADHPCPNDILNFRWTCRLASRATRNLGRYRAGQGWFRRAPEIHPAGGRLDCPGPWPVRLEPTLGMVSIIPHRLPTRISRISGNHACPGAAAESVPTLPTGVASRDQSPAGRSPLAVLESAMAPPAGAMVGESRVGITSGASGSAGRCRRPWESARGDGLRSRGTGSPCRGWGRHGQRDRPVGRGRRIRQADRDDPSGVRAQSRGIVGPLPAASRSSGPSSGAARSP
jgi:hypothetical protein